MNNKFKLEIDNITKIYPGTIALQDVSCEFLSGKVNALIGKNGSGKSTLVKIISGAIQPTNGNLKLDNETVFYKNPNDAFNAGISTVYQELSLVPSLSIAENIMLGKLEKTRFKTVNWRKVYKKSEEILKIMGVDLPVTKKVFELSIWQQQVVEIAKAISHNPRVLILDEPTSSLAQHEVESLFKVIKELKNSNVVIIYISHRLQELPLIADRITVLRDGKFINTVNTDETNEKEIIKMMFGETEKNKKPEVCAFDKKPVIRIINLTRDKFFYDININLYKGEILGIAGMLGSGRSELLRSIFGADKFDSGEIYIEDKKIKNNIIESKKAGLAMTPENRKTEGIIQILSIKENLVVASFSSISRKGVVLKKKERISADKQINDMDIKISNINNKVLTLSGGNQQKVVIGKWLNTDPKVMLFDEPTRGIDVNAKQQIFQIIWDQSKKGVASIFISSELEEILEVCHRILVMKQGRIIGELKPNEITVDELYLLCMNNHKYSGVKNANS